MPWLLLNESEEDELEVLIVAEGAERRTVPIGGEYTRAFDGTLRATVGTEKSEWDLLTLPLEEADATAIEAMFQNGTEFTLSGDIVGENTFDCMGTVVSSEYIHDGTGHKRQLRLRIQEV